MYKVLILVELSMSKILFPKGVALWLKSNTGLNLSQIASFCGLDMITSDSLDIKNTLPYNPIELEHLTQEEIEKGERDHNYQLKNCLEIRKFMSKSKRKYIPKNYRIQKPQFVAWVLHNYPQADRKKISSLFSTNRNFVEKVESSLNSGTQIVNPINAGFCTTLDIDSLI